MHSRIDDYSQVNIQLISAKFNTALTTLDPQVSGPRVPGSQVLWSPALGSSGPRSLGPQSLCPWVLGSPGCWSLGPWVPSSWVLGSPGFMSSGPRVRCLWCSIKTTTENLVVQALCVTSLLLLLAHTNTYT